MTNNFLLDSYAWIEYFLASSMGNKVRAIVENPDNVCYTSVLSITEVVIKLKKLDLNWESAVSTMKSLATPLEIDDIIAVESALLYIEKRKIHKDIGVVDVIIMIQARRNNLIVVTGDADHFKNEKNVRLLK